MTLNKRSIPRPLYSTLRISKRSIVVLLSLVPLVACMEQDPFDPYTRVSTHTPRPISADVPLRAAEVQHFDVQPTPAQAPLLQALFKSAAVQEYQHSIDLWVAWVDSTLDRIQYGQLARRDCEIFFDIDAGGAETRYHYIFEAYDELAPQERAAARDSFNATREKYKDVFALVNRECRSIGH